MTSLGSAGSVPLCKIREIDKTWQNRSINISASSPGATGDWMVGGFMGNGEEGFSGNCVPDSHSVPDQEMGSERYGKKSR